MKERERNIGVQEKQLIASQTTPPGDWPTAQACGPTGNGIGNLLFHRSAPSPQSRTSQGKTYKRILEITPSNSFF